MAIIVDKDKKRNDIACACKDILLEFGIKKLTVSDIARTAGVGKGTIYEYFRNKEEIVFEIMTVFIVEYHEKLSNILSEKNSSKKKLFHFFYLIFEDEENKKQLGLYREFIAISLTSKSKDMIEFNQQCRERFGVILSEILDIGIKNEELPVSIKGMIGAMLTFGLGLVIEHHTIKLDVKNEIEIFLDTLLDLAKTKQTQGSII